MKRKSLPGLLLAFLCAVLACAMEDNAKEPENTAFTAIISSDLHYSQNMQKNNLIIPLISEVDACVDAFLAEVIDRKPDVLILTGDLTNGGSAGDERALCEKLLRVQEQGISVVITPGNHDFDSSDFSDFEENYSPLLAPLEDTADAADSGGRSSVTSRDQTSASYVRRFDGVSLFAMDDSSAGSVAEGSFTQETYAWLKKTLKEEAETGNRILFLAHHPVLSTLLREEQDGSLIRSSDAADLIRQFNVQLILSGHLHGAGILEDGSLHEVISQMPWSGMHYIGFLTIDGSRVVYQAEPIDFRKYGGEALSLSAASAFQAEKERRDSLFDSIFEDSVLDQDQISEIRRIWEAFFIYTERGTIGEHAEEIRKSPYYPALKKALADTNYGPWMESILNNPPLNAVSLAFEWK